MGTFFRLAGVCLWIVGLNSCTTARHKLTYSPGHHKAVLIVENLDELPVQLRPQIEKLVEIRCRVLESPLPLLEGSIEGDYSGAIKSLSRLKGSMNPDSCIWQERNIETTFASINPEVKSWNEGIVNRKHKNPAAHPFIASHRGGEFLPENALYSLLGGNNRIKLTVVNIRSSDKTRSWQCLTSNELKKTVNFWENNAVQAAFYEIDNPIKRKLFEFINAGGYAFVISTLEQLSSAYLSKVCGVDYSSLFQSVGKIQFERSKRLNLLLRNLNAIVLAPSGDHGVELHDPSDSLVCQQTAENFFTVGSSTIYMEKSKFSNMGPCVKAYSLGSHVITANHSGKKYINSSSKYAVINLARFMMNNYPSEWSIQMILDEFSTDQEPGSLIAPLDLSVRRASYLYGMEETVMHQWLDSDVAAKTTIQSNDTMRRLTFPIFDLL